MGQKPLQKNLISLLVLIILGSVAVPIYIFLSSQKEADRDLERIAHITLIDEHMKDFIQEGKQLPIPQDATEIYFGDELYAYQGFFGEKSFRQLGIKVLRDPQTQEFYNYFLRLDNNTYEVMTSLEDTRYSNVDIVFQEKTYANGTSRGNFIVANAGEYIGKPIHFLTRKGQRIDLLDESKREKLGLLIGKTCKDTLDQQPGAKDGTYLIEMQGRVVPVYCDMTRDGGGWTLFYANHGHPPLAGEQVYSYIQMRDYVNAGSSFLLYDYDNPQLAGLLSGDYFAGFDAREILIFNNASPDDKWIKLSFSSSDALTWGLSSDVLGSTKEGCIKLPKGETWNVVNQDESIKYENLSEMMNHRGTSWGISHTNYWCNNSFTAELAHVAFYNANASTQEARARSNQGIGGQWGGENEYRYFIR